MPIAGTFTVVMDPHEVSTVEPDDSGKLTVRFQGGADHAVIGGELFVLDDKISRRGVEATSVSAGYEVDLPTDIGVGGDHTTSAVGYDLLWFSGDARVPALFTGQPADSTVYLSALVNAEPGVPVEVSAGYAADAAASADEAAASAAAAATWDPENYVGKNTLTFRVADHASFQATIDAAEAAGGGSVWCTPGATYAVTSNPTVTGDNVRLIGNGAILDGSGIAASTTLSDKFVLKAQGTIGTSVAVSADVAVGATSLTVASTAGLVAGDYIRITSTQNYMDGAVGAYGQRGALHRIKSIDTGTTLTLTEKSPFAYAAASTANIRKVSFLRGFYAENLRIKGGGTGDSHSGVQVEYALEPDLRHIEVSGCEDTGVQLRGCWGGEVYMPTVRNAVSGALGTSGYGVSILNASRHVTVSKGDFDNCRHGITGGGSPVSIHIRVQDCVATNCLAASFDVHEEAFWWKFVNCVAIGGTDSGFGIRGQYTKVIDCEAHNTGSHGARVKSYDTNSDGLNGVEIIGFTSDTPNGNNVLWEGTAVCRIKSGKVATSTLRKGLGNNVMVWFTDNLSLLGNVYDTTLAAAGGDGNNVRVVGSSTEFCTNVTDSGSIFRGAEHRPFRADFAQGFTVTNPTIINNGAPTTRTNYLTSCTNSRVVGYAGPAAPDPEQTVTSNANFTLTPLISSERQRHTGTLTADRTITLATENAYEGARFRVLRTGGGAFNLIVGGVKNLATNQWCEVYYNGTAWVLEVSGSL